MKTTFEELKQNYFKSKNKNACENVDIQNMKIVKLKTNYCRLLLIISVGYGKENNNN